MTASSVVTIDSGMGDRSEVGGRRTAIKTEPGEEDLVGSTTPTPSASSPDEVICSRSKLEECFRELGVPKEKINKILQSNFTPDSVRPLSTTGAESGLSRRASASAASDSTTSDVIVLDSDEGEPSDGEGAEEKPSSAMLNASDKKPPLERPAASTLPDPKPRRKVVVPKTEHPRSTQPNGNPTNEVANSHQYEGTTDGPPAISVKVELSEGCPNNATATEPSTGVQEEQWESRLQEALAGSSLPAVGAMHGCISQQQQLSTSSSSWALTMSPEVSGSGPTTKTTPKRGTTGDESPTATCKRLRMEDFTVNTSTSDQWEGEIGAHCTAVKLEGGFIYASSGCDVKRYSLTDPSHCVEYHGSTEEVRSLEVCQLKGQPAALYTASKDGSLRCYNTQDGKLTGSFPVDVAITCTTLAWNKIYLGLENGWIQVFSVQRNKLQERFPLFAEPVHRITTTTEGRHKEKLLCAVSVGGDVVVCDGTDNKKLWSLPPVPPSVDIDGGVFT